MIRPTRTRLRNPVAMSPLLRKGGVHKRSRSGVRADAKRETQDAISDWRQNLEEEYLETTDRTRSNFGDDFLKSPLLQFFSKNKQHSFSLLPDNSVQYAVF